jgi:hypothetical protein
VAKARILPPSHRYQIANTEEFFRSLGVGTRLADYRIPAESAPLVAARLAERKMRLGKHQDIGRQGGPGAGPAEPHPFGISIASRTPSGTILFRFYYPAAGSLRPRGRRQSQENRLPLQP